MKNGKAHDEAPAKITCVQMEPVVGMIEKAASDGASLAVLTELCNSGYVFESRSEAFALSKEVPGGPASAYYEEIICAEGTRL